MAVSVRPHFTDVAHALDGAAQAALRARRIARDFAARHVALLHVDQLRRATLRLVVDLRRLRLGDMHRAPGNNSTACCCSGELCNGQTYRHEQSLPASWEDPRTPIARVPNPCCINRDAQIVYRQLN
ncbi:hypothetical protein [Aurantiacibacter xanthus]|uniref:hypothetical protein n=1 Tax=Aurantiacibacter xanthus TaxID=1784712 RepID=UPI001FE6AAFD|nr:hypothetical protein [Aurantiacibacter xanthus]